MSSIIEANVKSYVAAEAIGAYLRVKKSGSKVAIAGLGADDRTLGYTFNNISAAEVAFDQAITVRLQKSCGSVFATASGAIAQNAAVYGAAGGKVSTTESGPILGYAEEAAADGDVFELMLA